MNIGIVCYPTYGGSGIVATELGMELAKKGHHVDFISYKIPERLEFVSNNIHFHKVQMEDYPLFKHQPYLLALANTIYDAAISHNLDIIHVHYAIPHAYAAHMAKEMLLEKNIDIKIITTLHGTDITLVGKHPSYKSSVEFSINKSDIVTAVSHSLRTDTLSSFNLKKDIEVIHNFIDKSQYQIDHKNCVKSNFQQSVNEKLVVHVSNFRKVKRIPDVIRIFNGILKSVNARLLLVGEGPEIETASNMIQELGIQDKVRFLGNHKNIVPILCAADLKLLPSAAESFGLAALEAMVCSTPVVASRIGGIPEVVTDGFSGYLCPVGNVDEMVSKSIQVLKDENLDNFKANALEDANRFDYNEILPQYEALYERVLTQ